MTLDGLYVKHGCYNCDIDLVISLVKGDMWVFSNYGGVCNKTASYSFEMNCVLAQFEETCNGY